jgi:hypothetical protein
MIGIDRPNHKLPLSPEHYRELSEDSGIADDVIRERGCETINNVFKLRKHGFGLEQIGNLSDQKVTSGLLIPGHGFNDLPIAPEFKPDQPYLNAEGKRLKYVRPSGTPNHFDLPPRCRADFGNPDVRLLVTEGRKKADAAASRGLCCIGLSGVYNFRGKNEHGATEIIGDFKYIPLQKKGKRREVIIVYDSDVRQNAQVRTARQQLAEVLEDYGAAVSFVDLPPLPDGEKCGLDDYLLTHSVEELMTLSRPAEVRSGKHAQSGKQADQLIDIAVGECELWHTPEHEAYATIPEDEHREHWAVDSPTFKEWLSRRLYRLTGTVANSTALMDATRVLSGIARHDGPEFSVHTRLAQHEGSIWLDLVNDKWQTVEISKEGWFVRESAPVKFRRSRGTLPLPIPSMGGSLCQLWRFANVKQEDRVLVLAWLVAAYRPRGPYPVLDLIGGQGCAKSTTARVLQSLVDPNLAGLRSAPRDERDLAIAANNSYLPAFDNLSGLPPWLSDALCRMATGGGFGTRKLHTDDEEALFNFQRPVLGTSIDPFITRSNLLDRCLLVELPSISDEERKPESEFWREFEDAIPGIIGALLGCVSMALARIDKVKREALPRMADFALWVRAAEPAFGGDVGSFEERYADNREAANVVALESSPIVEPLRELLKQSNPWKGTASELLGKLHEQASARSTLTSGHGWPNSPRSLSSTLRRLAPNLKREDVVIDFGGREGKDSKRMISVRQKTAEAVAK